VLFEEQSMGIKIHFEREVQGRQEQVVLFQA